MSTRTKFGGHARCFLHQAGHQVARQLLVDIQAHVSEFEADVRIQAVGRHLVQQLVIELCAGAGFLNVGDIFTKVVDADGDPLRLSSPATRIASSTWLPATKRRDTRWPIADRSAMDRRERLSDREINRDLSTGDRPNIDL